MAWRRVTGKFAAAIADAVLPFGVPILGMAFTAHETAYSDKGVELIPEFYADLDYDGRRQSDPQPRPRCGRSCESRGARVARDAGPRGHDNRGRDIPVKAATVCVHSDTPSAVAIAAELDRVLRQVPAQP